MRVHLLRAALVTGGLHYLGLDFAWQGGVAGTTTLGSAGLFWYQQNYLLKGLQDDLASPEALLSSFQRTHAREVQDADEFIASLWQRVRGALQTSLQRAFEDGGSLPSVSSAELQNLENILHEEIPRLRRKANNAS